MCNCPVASTGNPSKARSALWNWIRSFRFTGRSAPKDFYSAPSMSVQLNRHSSYWSWNGITPAPTASCVARIPGWGDT